MLLLLSGRHGNSACAPQGRLESDLTPQFAPATIKRRVPPHPVAWIISLPHQAATSLSCGGNACDATHVDIKLKQMSGVTLVRLRRRMLRQPASARVMWDHSR